MALLKADLAVTAITDAKTKLAEAAALKKPPTAAQVATFSAAATALDAVLPLVRASKTCRDS